MANPNYTANPIKPIKEFVRTTDLSQIVAALPDLGFLYVTLDLEGFGNGKLDRAVSASNSEFKSVSPLH